MKKQLLTSLAVLILGSSVAMASPQEWPGRYDQYPARDHQEQRFDTGRYDHDAYAYHRYEERAERFRRARLRRLEELRRLRRLREERWRWDRY